MLQVDGCKRMNHTKGLRVVIYYMTFQVGNTFAGLILLGECWLHLIDNTCGHVSILGWQPFLARMSIKGAIKTFPGIEQEGQDSEICEMISGVLLKM